MSAHDFSRLSSYDFQELARDLLQAEWCVRLETFGPGRDSGIDLRGLSFEGGSTIIQCKHSSSGKFREFLSSIRRIELPKIAKLAPSRYVLVTSRSLTPDNKKQMTSLLRPYVKSQRDILGREDLNNLLRRHPKVETSNFKLWLTSSAVLERVLHNAERCQTEFEIDRVQRKLPLFVQNDAFPRAQAILRRTRIVVVSGVPGIGKTTLADMILFAHLEQGYEPVVIQSGIEEARKQYKKNVRQVFYFDDFLGQTFLQDRPELLGKNQDAVLISFMEAIRASKASRFIMTTREHNRSTHRLSQPVYSRLCSAPSELVDDVVAVAIYFNQLVSLWELASARPSVTLTIKILAANPKFLSSVKRLLHSPHIRWADGHGTFVDAQPTQRLRELISWGEELQSKFFLQCAMLIVEKVAESWLHYVSNSSALFVLREIEATRWAFGNGGKALRQTILDLILSHLNDQRHHAWKMLFDYRSESRYWTLKEEKQFQGELNKYRNHGIKDECSYYESAAELERMIESLQEVQKNHKVSFRGAIKQIRAEISKRDDGPEEDDSSPHTPSLTKSHKQDVLDEQEIRDLFGTLLN